MENCLDYLEYIEEQTTINAKDSIIRKAEEHYNNFSPEEFQCIFDWVEELPSYNFLNKQEISCVNRLMKYGEVKDLQSWRNLPLAHKIFLFLVYDNWLIRKNDEIVVNL